MNLPLAASVDAFLAASPERLRMGSWGHVDRELDLVACLAGWTLIHAGYTWVRQGTYAAPDGTAVSGCAIPDEAARLLQLTSSEQYSPAGDSLFYNGWDDTATAAWFRRLVTAARQAAAETMPVRSSRG